MRRILFMGLVAAALAACGDDNGVGPDTRAFDQFDRMGRPAINTVFIPSAMKQAFNTSAPANDRQNFGANVTTFLTTVAGFTQANANALKDVLLPDILTVDVSSGAGFLNGRKLADDVITAELGIIFGTNAALNDDHVSANDKAFLSSFPYLASPTIQ